MHYLKKRRTTFRVPKTPAECLLSGHQWETIIGPGMFACTRCYLTAFCPECYSILPEDHTRQLRCPQHQGRPPQSKEGRCTNG